MNVRLLTGPKAGKIADVTKEYGRELIERGEAEPVNESGELWPEKEEAQPPVVVQPIIIEAEKKSKPRRPAKRVIFR